MKHGTRCLHGGETSVVAAHGHTGHTILLLLVDKRPEEKKGKNDDTKSTHRKNRHKASEGGV